MASGKREMDQLVRKLRKMGLRVEKSPSDHWRVYAPNQTITMASTPSRGRALQNAIGDLRRAGVPL